MTIFVLKVLVLSEIGLCKTKIPRNVTKHNRLSGDKPETPCCLLLFASSLVINSTFSIVIGEIAAILKPLPSGLAVIQSFTSCSLKAGIDGSLLFVHG